MTTTDDIDVFDAPTPGQSLTDEPKKWQWERPPSACYPKAGNRHDNYEITRT